MLPGSFAKPDRGDVALPDQAVPEHDKIDELKALSQVKEGLSGVGAGQRRSLREGWGNGIPAKPDLAADGHRAFDRPEVGPRRVRDRGPEEGGGRVMRRETRVGRGPHRREDPGWRGDLSGRTDVDAVHQPSERRANEVLVGDPGAQRVTSPEGPVGVE